MRIGTLCASNLNACHGTIRGGSFLSAMNIVNSFLSTINFSGAIPVLI